MSRVWLCQDPLAEQPYIVNKNISLYSFEELCYYLFQNAESVEESFFNGMLCQWLSEELGKKKLAKRLSDGMELEKSGSWCMEQILRAGGFYRIQDIEQALSMAKSMEDKSPAQRAKLRGDRLLLSGRYRDALRQYRKALKEESDASFRGRIWHNIGTLYARQFLFAPASECYKFAYEIGQQSESSEAYLLALSCREKQVSGRKSSIDEQLKQLREVKRSGKRVDYEQQMEQLLLQLRTEYRKSE
ncbi:MAG: hypothetical protein HFI74_11475 [Lachnospiraceae bacterium]|jgi:tetratricopeptide (TPR) repeat protein|nr:hypothetical protein [Lachnospiraceae bacterium]